MTAAGAGVGLWVLIWVGVGVVVVVAIGMSFFVRRHGEEAAPRAHWQRTDEVFVDPTTNRLMRVWVDRASGERHYVPDRR
ncbi:MAG: hypothetical protein QOI42_1084 [Frankiaceae bacterium]|nr:hypothetical protein [Frankiaceae bacterium]